VRCLSGAEFLRLESYIHGCTSTWCEIDLLVLWCELLLLLLVTKADRWKCVQVRERVFLARRGCSYSNGAYTPCISLPCKCTLHLLSISHQPAANLLSRAQHSNSCTPCFKLTPHYECPATKQRWHQWRRWINRTTCQGLLSAEVVKACVRDFFCFCLIFSICLLKTCQGVSMVKIESCVFVFLWILLMFVCTQLLRGASRVEPWHGNELNVQTLRRRVVRLFKIDRMKEIMMIARDRSFCM